MAAINTDSSFPSAIGVSAASETKPSVSRPPVTETTDAGTNPDQVRAVLIGLDKNSHVEVQNALETANFELEVRQRRLELSVDGETGIATVSVRDTKTGQILLQVPSEVSLKLAKRIDQLTGVLIDKTT